MSNISHDAGKVSWSMSTQNTCVLAIVELSCLRSKSRLVRLLVQSWVKLRWYLFMCIGDCGWYNEEALCVSFNFLSHLSLAR